MIGWFKPTTLQYLLPDFSRPNIEYVTQSESVLDKSLVVHNDNQIRNEADVFISEFSAKFKKLLLFIFWGRLNI